MKKFIKTIVSLTAASAMLLSTTAFAATTQTVTKYSTTGTTVTSTVSGLSEGSMVTYLAHTGNSVSETGDNIVYIGQETVGSEKSAKFEYTVDEDLPVGKYATIKYGSNVDEIEGTNSIEIGEVTVNYDAAACEVSYNEKVGSGDTTTLTINAKDGYEVVAIKKGEEQIDPETASIDVVAGTTVTITTAATTGDPAVYHLKGAAVETVSVDGVSTNSAIVRVVGKVKKVWFEFTDAQGNTYEMDKDTADATSKFEVSDLDEKGGYYGVVIEDTTDISNLSATAFAEADTAAVNVQVIE